MGNLTIKEALLKTVRATKDYVDKADDYIFSELIESQNHLKASNSQTMTDILDLGNPQHERNLAVEGSAGRFYFNLETDISNYYTGTNMHVLFLDSEDKAVLHRTFRTTSDSNMQISISNGVLPSGTIFNGTCRITKNKIYEYGESITTVESVGKSCVMISIPIASNTEAIINELKTLKVKVLLTKPNFLTFDNNNEFVPTKDYHPTTKKYVDNHFITDTYEDFIIITAEEMNSSNNGGSGIYLDKIKTLDPAGFDVDFIYYGYYKDKVGTFTYSSQFNMFYSDILDKSGSQSIGLCMGVSDGKLIPANSGTQDVKNYVFTEDFIIKRRLKVNANNIATKEYVDNTINTNDLVITNSISMGRKAGTTVGEKSVAVGYDVTASGDYSHAEGSNTNASGYCSHAEGATTASGDCSHAEGLHSEASADYSHAEGFATKASGPRSHAEGYYTIAAGNSQHVQGKHNIEDTTNTYAHIVGNGTSGSARSNAHTLDWEGNAWFAGNVKVGADSKKLATEDYVKINAECLFKASLGNYQRITLDNKSAAQVISSNTLSTYFPDAFLTENINGSIKRYNFNATIDNITYDANGIGDKSISESFDMVFVSLFNSEGETITQRYIALDSLTVIDFTNKVEGQHAYFKSLMLKVTPDAIYEANIGGSPVAKKGMIAVRWEVKSNTNIEEWINKVKDFKISIALVPRAFLATDNTRVYTPTSDYHPATKKYVDDKFAGLQIAQMTLAEYNALETKDPNTLYIIVE